MTDGISHILDEGGPSDHNFVYSSWLESYRESHVVSGAARAQYYAGQRALVQRLLARCTLLVARPSDWDSGILGWACFEHEGHELVWHYAFVKQRERRSGLGAELLEAAQEGAEGASWYTHKRLPWSGALERHGLRYDPYRAWL